MKIAKLIQILNSGVKPTVILTDGLWSESFGQKGMIAEVLSYEENIHNDGTFKAVFSYNKFRDHNLSLDTPDWWIKNTRKKGTALEANVFDDPNNLIEHVYFEKDQELPFELAGDNILLKRYVDSGDKCTYVEWLENFIKGNGKI